MQARIPSRHNARVACMAGRVLQTRVARDLVPMAGVVEFWEVIAQEEHVAPFLLTSPVVVTASVAESLVIHALPNRIVVSVTIVSGADAASCPGQPVLPAATAATVRAANPELVVASMHHTTVSTIQIAATRMETNTVVVVNASPAHAVFQRELLVLAEVHPVAAGPHVPEALVSVTHMEGLASPRANAAVSIVLEELVHVELLDRRVTRRTKPRAVRV